MKKTISLKKHYSIVEQLLLAGIFCVAALFIETITFLLLGFNALPQYLLLDISILFIISGFVFLIPSFKMQQTVYAIIIIAQIVLSYINVTLFSIFGTIVTVDMINLFAEATTALESSVINRGLLILFVVLALIYISGNVLFAKYFHSLKKEEKTKRIKVAILIMASFTSFQFIGFYGFNSQINEFNSVSAHEFIGDDTSLYNTLLFEAESLKKFGTFGFYLQDINATLFSLEKNKEERILAAQEFLQSGQIAATNEYTGISEGNNLIVVMVESLEWYAISEELTPTLYRLSQENVSLNNYHSKSKTNISEAFGFLGSYPLSQSFASVLPGVAKLTDNDFSYSLPNLLKQDGYVGLNYFINHEKDFYKRSTTHTNFGFRKLYDISDFSIPNAQISKWGDWPLDSDFFKGAINEIAPTGQTEPFFNWVTTMSMHGPYDGNYRLKPYLDLIDASNWVNVLAGTDGERHLKNYVAAAMDLDRAIEYLFEELENRNLLDTTTVVIYADHETYYHDLGIKVKGIDKANYQNSEIYRVPFFIYDNNLPNIQVNEFTSPYNILPTIMDLLGISYNENMYMGTSIFTEKEQSEIFWSLTGGVFDDNLFTINGIDIVNSSLVATKEEKDLFLQKVEKLIHKVLKFNDLYNYNLF